jgi:hypothetical protein
MKVTLRRSVVGGALAALLGTAALAACPAATAHGVGPSDDPASPATSVAAQAQPLVLGPGSRPGVAVDAAGTGYVAWNASDNPTSLQFCRLPRGAGVCDSRHAIVVPASTTSGSRPFVTVSGSAVRIVQYRYPITGPTPPGAYEFTSVDRGATFAPGVLVGTVPFEEGVMGPGDTLSGVPVNTEMAFQNVPLGGGSTVDKAVLSATHQNQASVGLVDAATPLAVFTQSNSAQWRRYDGSGDVNDIANWSPAQEIGVASYPKLAGGPRGLFLLAGDGGTGLTVRKFTGSGFEAPVPIGPGVSPTAHLTQDSSGRLHAVYQRDSADPLRLVHAVSDDGVTWRSGTVITQDIATAGGMTDLRVAVAPDHIGITVWATGVGDVRVASVGPDAPVDPAAVSFAGSPKSLKVSKRGTFKYSFDVAAQGSGKISLKSSKKVKIGSKKTYVKVHAKRYTAARAGEVRVKLKLSAKTLAVLKHSEKLRFTVTVAFGSSTFTTTLKLKAP